MIPGIQEIKSLAIKYSKKQLANMAQTGLIDPQKAVMAGMMRDRIAKEDMQPPTSTVAQDVLGIAPQPQMGMQPQLQMAQPQPQPQPAGVEALPAGNVGSYAGGGIVAFDDGGAVPGYAGDNGSLVYSGAWENLPIYSPPRRPDLQPAGSMGEVFSNLGSAISAPVIDFFSDSAGMNRAARQMVGRDGSTDHGAMRVDPKTGEPISFGEYLRRQEAERGVAALPEARRIVESVQGPAVVPAGAKNEVRNPKNSQGARVAAPPASTLKRPEISIPDFSGLKPEIAKVRAAQDLPAIGKERTEYLRSMGVDPEMYGKMIEKEEGKRTELQGRKEQAKGEALMEAGLGLIGARRGQEFQALGESGKRGLASLREANKDLRAAEEKLDDRINSFRVADQQAKQSGAEKDLARRDSELARVEAAERDAVKERNQFATKRAELGLEGTKIKSQADVSLYGTDVQKELGEKQLALKAREIANQAAYYKNSLAITEKRIQAMDDATKAKFAQIQINAGKLLQNDQGYNDLVGQLKEKYREAWTTNTDAQKLLKNYKLAFIGEYMDQQGALVSGIPNAASLLQE